MNKKTSDCGTPAESTLLYTAGRQLWKVRAVMIFLLAVGLAFVGWGVNLSQTYGLSPGDGGELRPLAERLAWGVSVGLLGLLLIVGMDLYGRLYVARIDYAAAAGCLHFETLRYWGSARRSVATVEIVHSKYHDGKFETEDQSVDAPWYFITLKHSRFPLILDAQGKFLDRAQAARLLGL
jgi:hypothetical protein